MRLRLRPIAGVIGAAAAAAWAIPSAPTPFAYAAPCPDAEVVFARGTTEAPGVGPTGQALVDSLRAQLGPKSLGVYAVDYPATTEFRTALDGIADARTHILATAASCPTTKMVLGGFSQGAAVMGFVTANTVPDGVAPADVPAPMPADVADHVSAVVLFGKPSTRFMHAINDPPIVIGPQYVGRAIDLCVDNDLVCDPHGTSFSAHNEYAETGMVDQGVAFATNRLQASWADEARAQPPATALPSQPPTGPLLAAPPGPTAPSAGDPGEWGAHLPPAGPVIPPGPTGLPLPPAAPPLA